MKTITHLVIFAISICTLHSQEYSYDADGILSAGFQQSTLTSVEMDFNLDEAFPIKTEEISNWGIIGTLGDAASYIKLRIMYDGYYLGAIKMKSNGASNIYSHEPWYYDCGGWMYWIERRDWALTESRCDNPNWSSDNLKASLAYIEGKHLRADEDRLLPGAFPLHSEYVPRTKTIKVTLVLEVKNATVNEIYIPGLGRPKTPRMLFEKDRKGVVVYVDRDANSIIPKRYDLTVPKDQTTSPAIQTIQLSAGDRVTYEVYGNTDVKKEPIIKGVPKIWASGYAAQREFITTPDYGPNQYHPWVGYEAQTHFRLINSYPEKFKKAGIKTNNWKTHSPSKSWEWIAQRRTDSNKVKYDPVIYYPKTKKFILNTADGSYKYQRESQALGWSKQIMDYYDKYSNKKLGNEKYLTGFDVDEFLYVGSKNPNAPDVLDWQETAVTAGNSKYYPNIISVHNYPVDVFKSDGEIKKSGGSKNNNWQNLWESEKAYTGSSNNIIYNIPEKEEYPFVWDSKGMPEFGFLLNDMITRYQKYKSYYDDDLKNDLPSNYYYNGYEIQDVASHRQGPTPASLVIERDTRRKPAPCKEGCWYFGNEGGENVKHQGQVKITIPTTTGNFIVSFKQQVKVPIDNNSNIHKGFYSSLQADHGQYTMGWGNKNTWTLQGVKQSDSKRISLVMLEYNAGTGMMLPASTKKIKGSEDLDDEPDGIKYATYNQYTEKLSASFEVSAGWVAIAAYYKTKDLKDSVIIAGRVPMVMDPPTSLTVPGSDPYPYFNQSLAISGDTNAIDLKEGQGDRAFETMNEVRGTIDAGRGYVHKLGVGQTKYHREYHIIKGNELNFSCLDVGRKMQSYWDNGSEDPYQSWRELAKRMPNDIISNKLDWNVYEMNADGAAPTKTGISTYTRHFNYQFNKVGTYEVWVTWKEAPKFTPTKVVVHVRENPDKEHPADYKNLYRDIERGKITLRPLSIEEQRWIKKHSKNLNGSPYTGIGSVELDRLKEYQVAEVDEILSEYAYVLGPRASEKIHREGLRRDFNDQYSWYHDHNKLELPEFIKTGFLGKFNEGVYNQDFDQNLLTWPETWDKIWLYHNPRKGTTAPVTDLTGVIRDGTDDVNQTMDVAFTKLEEAQSTLPWMRWFPWVAISPTNGYKMNRYIKTTLDLPKFLSNEGGHETGKGLFSGKAKTKVYDISNAIENMMWFDYGSPKATQVSTKELDRHLSDDKKNLLEFYNDLRYGRKMIFRPGNTGSPSNGDDILVKNKNPKKFTGSTITQDEIYIATAVVEDLSPDQKNIPGIPLLTFDGARSGRTLLNSTYTIDGGDASIVHKGRKKYLKIIANDWQNKDISINVNIPQHLFHNSSKGPGPRFADVVEHVYGYKVSLAREGEQTIRATLVAYDSDENPTTPMGEVDYKYVNSNSLTPVRYHLPNTYVTHPKVFSIKILKTENSGITEAPIIYLDDLTLIDKNRAYEHNYFNMKNASETELLNWLSESSYRFFDWNFKDIGNGDTLGVFLEAAGEEKISLSGQGMGIAVTLLAEKAGYITPTVAKNRITKVLRWLTGIQAKANYSELIEDAIGQTGWHGMPSHYFNLDGKIHNPPTEGYPNGAKYPLAVSTIDWAMCAQGLRLARQYYHDDHTIKILTTDLLMSVDWAKFVMPTKHKNGNTIYEEPKDDGEKIPFNNGGRIAFDVNPKTGEINMKGDAWGHDFSEETELVYLEVLASSHEKKTGESQHTNLPFTNMNDINKVIYIDKTKKVVAGVEVITERAVKIIDRKCKNGFIPSYFGSGFTYNWLQLWYGNYQWAYNINRYLKKSSYYDNSVKAYQADYLTAKEQFLGNAYMGLTAASTVDQIAPNGFVSYGKYLSNQGSDNYLAPQGEVVQVAPAPYGATLALPFNKAKAMEAIRAYIDLGFYHEYMGFPDNVVLKGTGALGPLPNWNQLDLNIAPIAMAIDLTKTAFISNQLINDKHAMNAYFYLYNSFIVDYGACPAPTQAHKKAEDKPVEITLEEAPQKDTILLYPNPNTGNFTLRIRIKDPGVYQGVFKDLQGRVLKHSQWEFDSGGTYEVPFVGLKQQGFSPGLYVMVVTGTSMKKSIPVLIKDK